jgi:phosphoserine phosphatase RsbU/P
MLANAREKRDADGQLTFTRVALFRAMERRRYERELVDARETADAANRELSQGLSSERQTAELREQFIAVLGHDLRNPLASIDAGVRMLLRAEHDERTVSVLNLMLTTTKRMGVLIDHVLDFARGRLGGGLDFERQNVASLTPILEQVIAEVRSSYPERQIDTDLDLGLSVEADPGRIGQLFSNLLSNAVTHGDPTRPVHVAAFVSSGRLEIAVSNRGEPIPEAAMERLFQPFYRGRVKPHQRGLGLGLYIASEIAQAHGGRIDVESDAEATRFTFRMPVSRAQCQ